MKIFVFGGTFDPVHEGHLGVIGEVESLCDLLVLAPTKKNPWKKASGTSFEQRIEMLEIVLNFEKISYSKNIAQSHKGIYLCEYEYSFAKELVFWLRKNVEPEKNDLEITWVVGPDIASEVTRWKDWDSLNTAVHVADSYAKDLHSTDVREGSKNCHPAIKSFIATKKLYN